jgi:hypothetical protein
VKRLGAVIASIACSALAAAMAAGPAQAASIHAASPAAPAGKCGSFPCANDGPYVWQSDVGAKDYMTVYDNGMIVDPVYDDFPIVAYGCETTTGYNGTHIYCHQQLEDTNECITVYKVTPPYGQLTIDSCTAKGGGQQYDELWWFDNTGNDLGFLLNYNGDVAYSNGDNGDHVMDGYYTAAPNNYWRLVSPPPSSDS